MNHIYGSMREYNMQKTIWTLIVIILLFSSPVLGGSVLVGTDESDFQSSSDWRKGMIEEQSFETKLSEFHYPVWFVSYMPNGEDNDVSLKIIQQGEVLEELDSYVPEDVGGRRISSLDAVSFVDYNQDENTDILIVKTWGDLTASVVYDGNVDNGDHHFILNRELSDAMTANLPEHTISNMIEYAQITGNQKNNVFYADIPEHFAFGSGAGAWGSSIDLQKDGSFTGHFWDSDMGGNGDGYDSTAYHCDCAGRFANIEKHGEYYYSMTLEEYTQEQENGTSWISEENNGEVSYRLMNIITDPRGIYPGTTYYLFLPGAPLSELPVSFTEPMIGVGISTDEPKVLLNYVLYNADAGAAFAGYN